MPKTLATRIREFRGGIAKGVSQVSKLNDFPNFRNKKLECMSEGSEFRIVSECIHGDNREPNASVGGGPSYSREA